MYNFGDSEAKIRPFAVIGLGATDYGAAAFATKTVQGLTRSSHPVPPAMPVTKPATSSRRVLVPYDRVSEVLFGLTMALGG